MKKKFIIIAALLFGLLLSYSVFITKSNFERAAEYNKVSNELAELRRITSVKPNISLPNILKDTLYLPGEIQYVDKYLDRKEISKKEFKNVAVSDTTMNRLIAALDLKTKEITNVTQLYTNTRAENLQLKQLVNNHKEYEYRDRFAYININDSLKKLNKLEFKADLRLVNSSERSNFLAPKRFYTYATTNSPYLKIDSLNQHRIKSPVTVFSMFLDNRVSVPFAAKQKQFNFNNPLLTTTLNAEINNSGLISGYIGGGVLVGYQYVGYIVQGGMKINLWRIRR